MKWREKKEETKHTPVQEMLLPLKLLHSHLCSLPVSLTSGTNSLPQSCSLSRSQSHSLYHSCSAIPQDDGTQGEPILVWGVVLDELEYMAICSQEVRGPYVAKGVRGPWATMIYEEETACRWQPGLGHGCRVHAVSSADAEVVEVVRKF